MNLSLKIISVGIFIMFWLLIKGNTRAYSQGNKDQLPVINTEVKSVAVFKNGLGFFMREGKCQPKDGRAITKWAPNAALGSLWISSFDKDNSIEEITALKEDYTNETEAASIEDLLKANTGKKVNIIMGDKIIEGTIKSVLEKPSESSKTLLLETKDGITALGIYGISKVDFPGSISLKYPSKEKIKKLKFKFSGSPNEAKIGISYLQKGITWIPSYLINIKDPNKAVIIMKAEIMNDIEDMENVDASFVVGYPSFLYSNILTPMALEENISQFISALNSGGRRMNEYGSLSNVMRQTAVSFDENERVDPELDYSSGIKGLSGESEEDLFLYQKKGLTLKKGERAYYNIFSDKTDYKHTYEWEIPNTMTISPGEREQVWHSIKITNSTDYPWTTAPAFVVSDSRPIAQNTINYTPKGSKVNLKLTIANDVKTDRKENEIDRKRSVEIYKRYYDLVTIEGELVIKNYKKQDINMEIKKNLTGEVIEISHNGKIKKIAEGLKDVNFNSILTWDLSVKAGEEINIKYKYKLYQRN
jgi:hypothetical protein